MKIKKGVKLLRFVKDNSLKDIVAAIIDGRLLDLNITLNSEKDVKFVGLSSEKGLEILRHSAAHIMAQAVKHIFKDAKFAIGPAIKNGFYYDMDVGKNLSENDLKLIEKEMRKIVAANYPFERIEVSKKEAIEFFRDKNEYKVEIINDINDDIVSFYKQGDFVDLCRGPHIPSTGYLKYFKLLNVAGAYFKGDERKPMLQRIYGTAFANVFDLDNHLKFLNEVKKRDHRKLAKTLDLFSISDDIGAGFIVWHPRGAMMRHILEDFELKTHLKHGYELVRGPELLKVDLWKKSGHFDHYRENMYFTKVDNQEFGLKPMNCLGHIAVYKSGIRSYKDLPKRYFELGVVHRHEKSGVLHGLLRVREFTQDDAHIFCRPDQLNDEIIGVLNFVQYTMGIFGFEYTLEISTRPDKSIGNDEDWELATNALINALNSTKRQFTINKGEGAFYGPKIDVKLKDALGRNWQCATIQCDFTLPERFDLSYIDVDGKKKKPVMIHRVILGSIERFIAVLIEHFAGDFPLWISPIQLRVLPVSQKHENYAKDVYNRFILAGFRTEYESRDETLSRKIRYAENDRIPYIIVIGDKEIEGKKIAVRKRKKGGLGLFNIDEFVIMLRKEISNMEVKS